MRRPDHQPARLFGEDARHHHQKATIAIKLLVVLVGESRQHQAAIMDSIPPQTLPYTTFCGMHTQPATHQPAPSHRTSLEGLPPCSHLGGAAAATIAMQLKVNRGVCARAAQLAGQEAQLQATQPTACEQQSSASCVCILDLLDKPARWQLALPCFAAALAVHMQVSSYSSLLGAVCHDCGCCCKCRLLLLLPPGTPPAPCAGQLSWQ